MKKDNCSKGEEKIITFLKENNIEYEREKKFDTRMNKPLPFDFYLPSFNLCIEYNGIQHYQKTKYSKNDLKKRQLNDQLRSKYCNKTGKELLTIPYWEYSNINFILTSKLLCVNTLKSLF